jgi:hypothetical protein
MAYDNDGPVYSMLSGKLLSAPACAYGPSTTGNCTTGWCEGPFPLNYHETDAPALAECNDIAAYFGGTCLGVKLFEEGPDGSGFGTISHLAYLCFRVQPNYGEPGSGA